MRYVLDEEYETILANYDDIYDGLDIVDILQADNDTIKDWFTLEYRDLFRQVKNKAIMHGKTRPQISYSILKLRRLLANMQKSKITSVAGGITYGNNDFNEQFPKFRAQNPDVVPTIKTVNKLRVKALVAYAKINDTKDLRSLRASLMRKLKLSESQATYLTKLYREMFTRSEINGYSEKGDMGRIL